MSDPPITSRDSAADPELAFWTQSAWSGANDDGFGVGVFDWDLAAERFTASAELYRLHGVAPGTTPMSEDWFATLRPDHRATIQAAVVKLVEAARGSSRTEPIVSGRGEYCTVLPDGSERWIASRSRVVLGAHGRPVRLVGVDFDITDRKRAEAALAESEAHFRHTAELNPQVPWTADPSGSTLDVSQNWLELTGLTREQTLDLGWTRALHPDDVSRVVAAWRHAIDTGEPYDLEYRIRLADGAECWVRARAFPRRDEQGRIVRWYGFTEDIHDRRVAQEALRRSEERFRLATEAMAGFLYDWDPMSGHVERFGEVEQVIGFRPEEIPPAVDWTVRHLHPDDRAEAVEAARAALAGDAASYSQVYRFLHRDGHYVFLADRFRIVRDAEGRAIRALGGVNDISRRWRLEQERTALLEREQEARRAAEVAVRARDEVLGVVSHDLRSPLSAIAMCASALLQNPDTPPETTHGILEAIQHSADSTSRMIQDLMDVASIEAGRLGLELHDEAPAAVIHGTIELFRAAALDRGVVLDVHLAADLPVVRVDVGRIIQALGNLVTNALRFTEHGGRVILCAEHDPKGVRFTVDDSGAGIAAEDLPHVFDRYWRKGPSGVRGTGLGLAIVRGIVEAHASHVVAESEMGKGSRFSFTISAATG